MANYFSFDQFIVLSVVFSAVIFVSLRVGARMGVQEVSEQASQNGYFCHKGTRFHVMLIDGETPVERNDRLGRIEERIAMLRRFANVMRGIP